MPGGMNKTKKKKARKLRYDTLKAGPLAPGSQAVFLFALFALGLCCCVQAFSSCSKQGLLFLVVLGLLTVVYGFIAQALGFGLQWLLRAGSAVVIREL